MCNHRCFSPRAAQRNAESGAVWNTSSPAHKGDVNVIRAHWSGKSSTGSWRLDGEVSPGFWGGWGRGKGRSRWSQRLYGWWSKLKWGARGRQFAVQNIAGWPVHCWTVGHREFQRVLQRPLFAPRCTRRRAKNSSRPWCCNKKETLFLYFSSVFSPILAAASVESFPSTLRALHVLKNIFPTAPRARPGRAWMFRWWKESIRRSSRVALVIYASRPHCPSTSPSFVPRPSASVIRLANAHHSASCHKPIGSLWQEGKQKCNQGLDYISRSINESSHSAKKNKIKMDRQSI